MSVTQAHMANSGFSVTLRNNAFTAQLLGRVNPYDHIAIVPRGVADGPHIRTIKNAATFVGRLDQIDGDRSGVTLAGPGIAVWLGDGGSRGAYPTSAQAPASSTVDSHLTSRMPPLTNGLRGGLRLNLQGASVTFGRDRFVTWRQAFNDLSDQCDISMEWHVNPSGQVDIEGFATTNLSKLLFQYHPNVLLSDSMERTEAATSFGPLSVVPADIGVTWDFSQFARRGVAVGNNTPATVRTPADQKPLLQGRSYDPSLVIDWDVVVDGETANTTQLDALARSASRAASVQRQWQVAAGDSELARLIKPGDWIWVDAEVLPGVGSMTIAEEQSQWALGTDSLANRRSRSYEINIGGRNIHPAKARVASIDWPISDAWDVFLLSTFDGSGDVTLLTPHVEFEDEGPVSIDCNASRPQWQLQQYDGDLSFRRQWSNINRNVRASRRRVV